MKLIVLVFLMIPVIFISGCSIPNVFGGDVLKVSERSVHDGTKDILIIKDVETIPRSPILPGQQITFSFVLENRDKLKSAENVKIDLFNAPGFRAVSGDGTAGELCNTGSCLPEGDGAECTGANGCEILPGEEKLIIYRLTAPTKEEIVNVKTQTKLDFRVEYSFDATLNFIMPVVNIDEIEKRQRAGDTTTLLISRSHSSGPLEIDVEVQGAPYFLWKTEGVLLFKIRNRGSGTVVDSEIPKYEGSPEKLEDDRAKGMRIEFDSAVAVKDDDTSTPLLEANKLFTCTTNGICVNTRRGIQLFRDESRTSMRFVLDTRSALKDEIPFKSLEVKAKVNYDYELRGSKDITINPFENV